MVVRVVHPRNVSRELGMFPDHGELNRPQSASPTQRQPKAGASIFFYSGASLSSMAGEGNSSRDGKNLRVAGNGTYDLVSVFFPNNQERAEREISRKPEAALQISTSVPASRLLQTSRCAPQVLRVRAWHASAQFPERTPCYGTRPASSWKGISLRELREIATRLRSHNAHPSMF